MYEFCLLQISYKHIVLLPNQTLSSLTLGQPVDELLFNTVDIRLSRSYIGLFHSLFSMKLGFWGERIKFQCQMKGIQLQPTQDVMEVMQNQNDMIIALSTQFQDLVNIIEIISYLKMSSVFVLDCVKHLYLCWCEIKQIKQFPTLYLSFFYAHPLLKLNFLLLTMLSINFLLF